ncbi:MAG TPA: DNA polymerase IV [Candidatus Limnocylindrales bacterium]|nr:DNA polymerase IV [Candidatus Limnocylindrales bacterium]
MLRKIIHLDMDAFYASIEQRDNPALKGQPVIVVMGLDAPHRHGAVATASYEARKFGVHSAMPLAQATRLCPQGIFLPVRLEYYRQVSRQVMEILSQYTALIEPVSIDESYLDVTANSQDAVDIAIAIKQEIKSRLNLTATAGVGPNKFIAKLASGMHKPDGLTVVRPHQVQEFLRDLPVESILGVGPVTQKKLNSLKIFTIGQLAAFDRTQLKERFGKLGLQFYDFANGIDLRPVMPARSHMQISRETTLGNRIPMDSIHQILTSLAEDIEDHLKKEGYWARTVTVKVRLDNQRQMTRSRTVFGKLQQKEELLKIALPLLNKIDLKGKKIRRIGLSVSNLISLQDPYQPQLFD